MLTGVMLLLTLFLLAAPLSNAGDDGGVFGDWCIDSYGGACYSYTLNQATDKRAVSNDTDPYYRLPTVRNCTLLGGAAQYVVCVGSQTLLATYPRSKILWWATSA